MNKPIIIGVSGDKGSFSEEAANLYVREDDIKNYEIKHLTNVGGVLKALNNKEIDKGVFPVQNTLGGIVTEALEAMSQYNFAIEKVFELNIRHNLMVLPGTKKEEINKVVSHPQSLKQCRLFLKYFFPEAEIAQHSDNGGAARDLSKGLLGKSAAVISPKQCAKIYGLEILQEGIQDTQYNFTTFVAVNHRAAGE